jgi:hypothetical protein
MPSYTTSLRLVQPATGEYSGTWGTEVNNGLTALVDASIAGTSSITMTAANFTLTTANGASDQSRAMFLVLGGTPGASFAVIVPSVSKLYFVTNNTGFAQTVRTSGTGISVPNGASMTLRCDGTNVVVAQNYFASMTLGAALPAASGGTGSTSAFTANGIVYASSTSVLATSSAATFDGTNFATTGQVQAASYNGGQLAGMRNKIINGKMEIAQRGTSFAAIASSAYSLDRWTPGYVTSAVTTISQQSDVPSSNEFQSSLRIAVTTADTSIAAGDGYGIEQKIEGYNVRDLIGRTFTLSFWVRSSKTGIHCVSLRNSGNDRSYVAEYTINAANTWEQKSITVNGGLITAGTWNWTDGVGINLRFELACGSNFYTTANAWQTGLFLGTSNQVNCLDSTSNIFAITGVQLEVGGVATPFEHRPFGAELALAQRYYEKSYSITTNTGTATANGMVLCPSTDQSSSQYVGVTQTYRVEKRAEPSTVSYWDVAGNSSRTSTYTTGGLTRVDNNNNVQTMVSGTSGFYGIVNTAAAVFPAFQWAVSAEL